MPQNLFIFIHQKLPIVLIVVALFLASCTGGADQSVVEQPIDSTPTALATPLPTATQPPAPTATAGTQAATPTTEPPTLIATAPPTVASETKLETDLVLHLPFDADVADVSGSGIVGEPFGDVGFIADRFGVDGAALRLDGVDDYVAIAHDERYAPTSHMTLSTWFFYEPQPSANTFYSIIEKGDPERGGHSRWGFWTIGDQAEFCIQSAGTTFHHCLDTVDGLQPNRWHHIVGSWDTERLAIYLDGVLQAERTYSTDTISSTPHELFIGTDLYNDGVVYTLGAIDDVQLWKRALSAEEVTTLYTQTSSGMLVENVTDQSKIFDPVNEQIAIAGVDGLSIVGDFQASGPQPQPAVLLLHMLNNRRQSWDPLIPALVDAGYAVLTIDMRGHGETGGTQEWALAEQDMQLVFDWLQARPEVIGSQVAVVGASIGANMAIRTGANDTEVASVVMLSGVLNYRNVTTDDAVKNYGDKPVLFVAAEGDANAANSARTLADIATGVHELVIYDGSAHGTGLFSPKPEVIPLVVSWLNQTVGE